MSSSLRNGTAGQLRKLREWREAQRASLAKWRRHENDVQVMLSQTRDKASRARKTVSETLEDLEDMKDELLSVDYDSGAETRRRRRRTRPVVDDEYGNYADDLEWKRAKMQWKLEKLMGEYHASLKEEEDALKQCDKLEEDL
jgi:hypothetical protein